MRVSDALAGMYWQHIKEQLGAPDNELATIVNKWEKKSGFGKFLWVMLGSEEKYKAAKDILTARENPGGEEAIRITNYFQFTPYSVCVPFGCNRFLG